MGTEMEDKPKEPGFCDIEASLRSSDWSVRRDGVERAADLLKSIPESHVVASAASHFERLAEDPKWEVRHALAFALQYLSHPSFDRILAKLVDDPNDYVRRSADNTLRRRRMLTRLEDRREDDVESILDKVNRLKARYPADLAEKALALGRAYYEVAASGTTHDILNVLTALGQSLKSLKKQLEARKVPRKVWKEILEKAERRCGTIESIASDMKLFAEQPALVFHKEDVLSMVQESIGIVRDRFRGDNVESQVTEELDIEKNLMIDAPRTRLIQAFTNIIKNAFEAMEHKGRMRITGRLTGSGDVVLNFWDNGCGIFAEDIEKSFLPGTSTKKGKPGRIDNTGMGLAIAQKVIEDDCRGRITLESREGEWTNVAIALPVERALAGE